MCDHPIEQACECERMADQQATGTWVVTTDGHGLRGILLAKLLARLRSLRDWGRHALMDAKLELREEQKRHQKAAVDRDTIHSELVQLRLAYAAIEEERNRLRQEHYAANRRRQEETERRHRNRALMNHYKGAMAFIASKEDWPEEVRGYAVNVLNDTPGRADSIPTRATETMIRVVAELRAEDSER